MSPGEKSSVLHSGKLKFALLACLGSAALISLSVGVRHALLYSSHDLQWTGGRLLANHIDPWNEVLSGYPHHPSDFSPPNYLHLLYLLWLPFTALSFQTVQIGWCAACIGFSLASVALLRRLFELSDARALLLLFLLWMSSPFRVALETGQMSLFELFFFTLTFSAASVWVRGTAFGFSLAKYSFSPIAFCLFLLRGRFKVVFLAGAISALALLGVKLLVATPLLPLAREPFLVSRLKVSPGLADIMTFVEYAFHSSLGSARAASVAYGLAFSACVLYAILISRFRLTRQTELVLVSLPSLLFLKHLTYDYVFLAIPLAYALRAERTRDKLPIFIGIFVFWFLTSFLDRAVTDEDVRLVGLAANVLLLSCLVAWTTYVALKRAPGFRS